MKQRILILSLILTLTLVASLFAGLLTVSLSAAEGDFTIENGVLTKYNGTGGDVTIPDSVTYIGDGAFYRRGVLTGVTTPASATNIGDDAFSSRTLTGVTIPSSVTGIGDYAFCGCTGLTSIIIPDSVTSISNWAFENCTGLTSVSIGNSVTYIGGGAFYNCTGLTNINVDENNPVYSSIDGVLYNKNQTELVICPEGKGGEYIVPNSVTGISDNAFLNCTELTCVKIPAGVKTIGKFAFAYCWKLTDITIPASVTSIGDSVFVGDSEFTIHGYTGSYAQTYADENGIPFVSIGDAPAYTLGDPTDDGNINVFDMMAIRNHIFGTAVLEDNAFLAADVNGDGELNVFDMMEIRNHIFGTR